jgi:hypothetical protein
MSESKESKVTVESVLVRLNFFEPLALYVEMLTKGGFVDEAERCKQKYRRATSVDPEHRHEQKAKFEVLLEKLPAR